MRMEMFDVDGKYRLRLYFKPRLAQLVLARARQRGFSVQYYVIDLILRDLRVAGDRPNQRQLRARLSQDRWVQREDHRRASPLRSVAGQTLAAMDVTSARTRQVAEAAELSYQQAYRQLTRDPGVDRVGSRWRVREVGSKDD